jgi:hypothetical protein
MTSLTLRANQNEERPLLGKIGDRAGESLGKSLSQEPVNLGAFITGSVRVGVLNACNLGAQFDKVAFSVFSVSYSNAPLTIISTVINAIICFLAHTTKSCKSVK